MPAKIKEVVEAPLLNRIAELESVIRSIYSAAYDPEGMTEADTLALIIDTAGEAIGLPIN